VLPPGPKAPLALQTYEWVARPTALLRRCQARYGEPFTLRMAWADAPMVLISDPVEIKRVFSADPDVVHAGASSAFLEPFAGPHSILVLDGAEHLRQRRLMLPPFHGDRLQAHRELIGEIAAAEVASWAPGQALRSHPRMQAVTLEVMMRVVFGLREGSELEHVRAAIRRALDMTTSLPRLVAMALVQRDLGRHSPWGAFRRAVAEFDVLLLDVIRHARSRHGEGSILALLLAARHEDGSPPGDGELRDQLVTLLAAGHETTAGSLAWALERLARHPAVLERLRDELESGDDTYLEAVVKEVLRTRPVLSVAARKLAAPFTVGGWELPAGVHVAPCIYLTHRRPELYPEPSAFRPERFLGAAPPPYTWIPFGGGVRRCLGAAFATMEMKEVLRAVLARVNLGAPREAGERVRRRTITLVPASGGIVIPQPLRSSSPRCRSSVATIA
jgi:cytochrome P450 family 135